MAAPVLPTSLVDRTTTTVLPEPKSAYTSCHPNECAVRANLETVPAAEARNAPDGSNRKVLYSQRFKCHRAAPDKESKAQQGHVIRKSRHSKKDAACPYVEDWVVFEDKPNMVYKFEVIGHMGHTPGDAEDLPYLHTEAELETKVKEVSCCLSCISKHYSV